MPKRLHLSSVLAVVAMLFVASASVQAQEQGSPDEPSGITVIGYGEAAAPAETVLLQILISRPDFGPPQPPRAGATPGEEERTLVAPVVASLVDAGVAEEDVAVVVSPGFTGFYGPFGPGIARVDLTLRDVDLERINEVIDAATIGAADERLSVGPVGVSYEVEDCAALERQARQQAIADARTRAELQAELLDVQLGAIVASRDVPAAAASTVFGPYGPVPAATGGCAPPTVSGFAGSPITLGSFDPTAPAEVEVYAQVSLTFAIG